MRRAAYRPGYFGIWIRLRTLTSLKNRNPPATTMTSETTTPSTLEALTSASTAKVTRMASRAINPSTAQYRFNHIPPAHSSMRTVNTIVWPAAACTPLAFSFTPARNSPSWANPLAAASSAPTVIGHGRSRAPSGVSVARTAASRASERLRPAPTVTAAAGGFWRWPRLRLRWPNSDLLGRGLGERLLQARGRSVGVAGLGERAHDRHPTGPGGGYVAHAGWRDPSDGKERHAGVGGRVAHQLQANRRPAGLGRRGVHRADADVVHSGGEWRFTVGMRP